MPDRNIPATHLVLALMDRLGITDAVITEQDLQRIGGDTLSVATSATDSELRPGMLRLNVERHRSPIMVTGRALDEILRPGPVVGP